MKTIYIMSRFLKLTNIIINKTVIQHIHRNKDTFIIHLMSGEGAYRSYNTEIVVCKTKNLSDYKIVTDWIDNELSDK